MKSRNDNNKHLKNVLSVCRVNIKSKEPVKILIHTIAYALYDSAFMFWSVL